MTDPPLTWVRELGPSNSCEDEDETDCDEVNSATIGDGNSPYEFYVKPATSSALDSSVGSTETRRRAASRRSLFAWHLDDEEASLLATQAAEEEPFALLDEPRLRTVTRTGHVTDAAGRQLLQSDTSTAPVLYAQVSGGSVASWRGAVMHDAVCDTRCMMHDAWNDA